MDLSHILARLPQADLTELLRIDLELRLRRDLAQVEMEQQAESLAASLLAEDYQAVIAHDHFLPPTRLDTLQAMLSSLDDTLLFVVSHEGICTLLTSQPAFSTPATLPPDALVKGFLAGIPVVRGPGRDIWARGTKNNEPHWVRFGCYH